MRNVVKIVAVAGIAGTMIAMTIADPFMGIMALIVGGLFCWGISAS